MSVSAPAPPLYCEVHARLWTDVVGGCPLCVWEQKDNLRHMLRVPTYVPSRIGSSGHGESTDTATPTTSTQAGTGEE